MRCDALLISLCIVWVLLPSCRVPLCPQEVPAKAKLKPNPIEGIWMEMIWDTNQGTQIALPQTPPAMGSQGVRTRPHIWKFTKETVETGPDEKDKFPQYRYTYKLNPGNQEGAIDLVPLRDKDKDKKKDKPKTQLAIYFVKDDYLIINFGRDARPKDFTITKDSPNWVYILRRGKLQSADSGSAKPKEKIEKKKGEKEAKKR